MRGVRLFLLAAALVLAALPSAAQNKKKEKDKAEAFDFTAQVFITATGEFSPNVFKLEKFASWNFHAIWEDENGKEKGGKFDGILFRIAFRSDKEVFAEGLQARLVIREMKTNKVLKTWDLSGIYIDDNKIGYRAAFFEGLNCRRMEITLTSYKTKIQRVLDLPCGE